MILCHILFKMSSKKRIISIDILRGFVMVIMLLDHVRERFFYHMPIGDPMDIYTISPDLFFTRLPAHLCAPIFIFLTGLSAWLYSHPSGGKQRSASSFLLKRGLFIISIEVTLINFSWFGAYHTLYLQVMWAIGLSMIALAVISKLPHGLVGFIGFLIIFGHNALTPINFQPNETGYTLWTILHDRGFLINEGLIKIKVSYPVLSWIGLICVGYFTGPLFSPKTLPTIRKKTLCWSGMACLTLLVVLRGFNIYGEAEPWEIHNNFIQTFMSFLNYTKYPASLDFMLFTMGIALPLLVLFEKYDNPFKALRVYGSAPLFFYVLHLYVLLILYKICFAVWGETHDGYFCLQSIGTVWLLTATLAVLLYFPTQRFATFKHNSRSPWIKYF